MLHGMTQTVIGLATDRDALAHDHAGAVVDDVIEVLGQRIDDGLGGARR